MRQPIMLLLAAALGLADAGCTLPAAPAGMAYATAKGCGAGDVMPGNCTGGKECSCAAECVAGFGPTRHPKGPPPGGVKAGASADPPPPPPPGPAPTAAYTCVGTKLTAPTLVCAACEKGTYKNLQANSACTPCAPSATTADPGATAVDQCDCGAGYSGIIKKASDQCTACGAGMFGTGGATAVCNACPAHATTEATASKAVSDCVCAAGYTGTVTTPSSACTACPQSQYKAATGGASCGQCPPNADTAVGGSAATAVTQCLCNPGYSGEISVPASKCTSCVSGTYKQDDGPSSCTSCPQNADTRGTAACVKIADCMCAEDSENGPVVIAKPTDTCFADNGWKTSELFSIAAMIAMGLGLTYYVFIKPTNANENAVRIATRHHQDDLEEKLADLVKILSEIPPEVLAGTAGSLNNEDGAGGSPEGGGGGGTVETPRTAAAARMRRASEAAVAAAGTEAVLDLLEAAAAGGGSGAPNR